MRKRLLALLLCLCMIVACVPAVSAATSNVISTSNNAQTGYDSLESALADAKSGTTVTLQKDITAGRVVVPDGVKLDLNGYTLTADFAVIVNGQLFSSVSGKGKIIIPENKLTIVGDNNGVLPVWDPQNNCYILAKATYQQMMRVATDFSYAQYIFIPNFDAATVKLLADGGADNGVAITVQLSWDNGACQQKYTFPEDMVQKVYSSFRNGVAGQVFMLTVSGIAGISDMKISAVAESTAGGAIRSTAQNLDASAPVNFTVTFKDWDGTVLKSQIVKKGNAATAPADPVRKDYAFTGWDKAFDNITSDLEVTAQYRVTKLTIRAESVTVNKGTGEVTVAVRVLNNPGILTTLLRVDVDDSVLGYKRVAKPAGAYPSLNLTGPGSKITSSPYRFLLDGMELTEADKADGVLFNITFTIKDTSVNGKYEIKLSYEDGDITDESYQALDVNLENGYIIIE